MKTISTAFGFGLFLFLVMTLLAPRPVYAQKILRINQTPSGILVTKAGDDERVRVTRGQVFHPLFSKAARPLNMRFSSLALPENRLFPPVYTYPQPHAKGPDMMSRIEGGATSQQGSKWRGTIEGGKTVQQGSSSRSHIKGGRTVEGGARWASHMTAGRTVEQGSPFASAIPNWRFSAFAGATRREGIANFSARRARSPWASRLR